MTESWLASENTDGSSFSLWAFAQDAGEATVHGAATVQVLRETK